MQIDELMKQLPVGKTLDRLPRLRLYAKPAMTLIIAGGIILSGPVATAGPGLKTDLGAKTAAAQSSASKSKDAAPGDFVGSEVCATCHEEVAKGFATNPHAKMAEMHGSKGVTCENCHGAGKAHVEAGGDKTKIFNPATASVADVDAKCLGCHQGQHQNFNRSAHAEGNVSCLGCHDIHSSKEEGLLKAPQPTLCYQCHTDVKPQFSMPFHHKVNEGLVQCSDCHDPHGTFEKKSLKSAAQQDAVCVKCHTETAGPFVYEHNVVKTEGCVACHTPHGGPNPRLLNRANVNTICLQCHSPSPNFTTGPPAGPSHNQAMQYQSCLICHASIHGSNTSEVFFNSTE
ncbi:MAG: DmsE family decaheme c-type cytochrome [Terracidiphilus sp.]|jgi:DmsE family decaheme c-type cytochrome